MKLEGYRAYLQGQNIPDDTIEERMAVVGDFAKFIARLGLNENTAIAGKEEVEQFARQLITEGRNTLENFRAPGEYADWLGQWQLYVALIEVMDCHNALAALADELEERHGRWLRNRIISETLPPLGTDEKARCARTRTITEHMAQQVTPQEARAVWFQVQHGIPAEVWCESDLAEKEKYRQCGSIDEFLALKRQERDALLTRLHDEHKLWYTIEINDEVLEFIKSDPEMEGGRREGNKIYITKVPYNASRYLHATDTKMKRYCACHCPLLREAILNDWPISPEVCYCSLGHASHYLAGLDMELKGEVLESAIKGDVRCRFVFYLPNEE